MIGKFFAMLVVYQIEVEYIEPIKMPLAETIRLSLALSFHTISSVAHDPQWSSQWISKSIDYMHTISDNWMIRSTSHMHPRISIASPYFQ